MTDLPFPAGFLWGAATSAHQIEGGADLDGRGLSIWDTFAATPGAIRDGSDGRVAADHRNRWRADLDLLATLGVDAYRFSVAWPRVLPTGAGAASEAGLDFYRALVDGLLERGIEPVVTLYHWDLPQPLEDAGGWPARATAHRFAEYAAVVGAALGDRVRRWSTINEPWCASMLGYASGVHAPGRSEPAAAIAAAHHLLLGHGLAVNALRVAAPGAEVAVTLNPYPVVTAGDDERDLDAARRVDGLANRLWYDAVLRGRYPDDVVDDLAAVTDMGFVRPGDLQQIRAPIDALGVNYYRRHHVRYRAGASAVPPHAVWPGSLDIDLVTPVGPVTDGGWAVEPDGLLDALLTVARDHPALPLYVHESGAAYDADPDLARVAYLDAHIRQAHAAIEAGVDLRGFFVWSLLDNFEWAEGYAHRFGIVRVDFDTLERTPRDSARWYADLIRRRSLPTDG